MDVACHETGVRCYNMGDKCPETGRNELEVVRHEPKWEKWPKWWKIDRNLIYCITLCVNFGRLICETLE